MTDIEVVEAAERMARTLLLDYGYEFKGESVRKSINPRAMKAWALVTELLNDYNGTDLDSAVSEVDAM